MAKIIEFRRKERKVSDAERLRALVEGRIRHFNCNGCGADIEVIDKKFPKCCPGCGLEIEEWNDSEEHT